MTTPSPTRRSLAALERSRFLVLLAGLVAMIGFLPIVSAHAHTSLLLDAGLLLLLIVCIWSMGRRRRVIMIGCVLLVPAVIAAWETGEASSPLLDLVGLGCALAFLAITALELLVSLLREREVVTDTVLGGLCVYLLFVVIWALLYQMMERANPGSFAANGRKKFSLSRMLRQLCQAQTRQVPRRMAPIITPGKATWTKRSPGSCDVS
jgi:hypothetical protein